MHATETFESAARILRECGVNAAVQNTGGTTECIVVATAGTAAEDARFIFGTAGERWTAEVVEGDPSGLWTDVDSDEDNPTQIARGILAALGRFSQNQA